MHKKAVCLLRLLRSLHVESRRLPALDRHTKASDSLRHKAKTQNLRPHDTKRVHPTPSASWLREFIANRCSALSADLCRWSNSAEGKQANIRFRHGPSSSSSSPSPSPSFSFCSHLSELKGVSGMEIRNSLWRHSRGHTSQEFTHLDYSVTTAPEAILVDMNWDRLMAPLIGMPSPAAQSLHSTAQ